MPEVSEKTPRLKQMFQELHQRKAELVAKLRPAREFYEAHVNDPRYLEARRVIKEVSAELAPIDNEIAALARALGARGIKADPGVFAKGE